MEFVTSKKKPTIKEPESVPTIVIDSTLDRLTDIEDDLNRLNWFVVLGFTVSLSFHTAILFKLLGLV